MQNIFNFNNVKIFCKHLKEVSQAHTHKGNSQIKKKLTIYAATILRLGSTQK